MALFDIVRFPTNTVARGRLNVERLARAMMIIRLLKRPTQ
jgi:hypothetical protein